MVVGNGIIAESFKSFVNNDELLIFASGVSSSLEIKEESFEREKNLLLSFRGTKKKLIYFSSIRIDEDTRYFKHKKNMEELIIENFQNYLIFRLPNIIAFGGNKTNFFNFIKNKIVKQEEVIVHDVYRSLVDVDDVEKICKNCFQENRRILEFAYIQKSKVIEIINIISNQLKLTPKIIISNGVLNTKKYENSDLISKMIHSCKIDMNDYHKKLIKKYL